MPTEARSASEGDRSPALRFVAGFDETGLPSHAEEALMRPTRGDPRGQGATTMSKAKKQKSAKPQAGLKPGKVRERDPRIPPVGSVLTRTYKKDEIKVKV